jgi:hypothetical protein
MHDLRERQKSSPPELRRRFRGTKNKSEIEGSVVMLTLLHAVAAATLSLDLRVTIDIAIAIKIAIALSMEIIMNAIVTKGLATITALGIRKD